MLNLKFWTAITERHIELGILKTGFLFQNLYSYKYNISDHRGSSLKRLFSQAPEVVYEANVQLSSSKYQT